MDIVFLCIEDARRRAERAAAAPRKGGAEDFLVEALERAQEELSNPAKLLTQGTFSRFPRRNWASKSRCRSRRSSSGRASRRSRRRARLVRLGERRRTAVRIDLLRCYGVDWKEAWVRLEYRLTSGAFVDLLWPGVCLIEIKRPSPTGDCSS
ncbi:MAG: hypothetical protein H0V94_06530 [Actinobacteria bacterium]|nr:hypothetical protein [Actinomycetota bacterium]